MSEEEIDEENIQTKRKIVGRKVISVISHFDHSGRYFILALCDDGTLWKMRGLYEGTPQWESFPMPPV
jgi:hypothetical protein